jgi:hypothetical protein
MLVYPHLAQRGSSERSVDPLEETNTVVVVVGYGTLTESDKIELKPMVCGPPIRDGD